MTYNFKRLVLNLVVLVKYVVHLLSDVLCDGKFSEL